MSPGDVALLNEMNGRVQHALELVCIYENAAESPNRFLGTLPDAEYLTESVMYRLGFGTVAKRNVQDLLLCLAVWFVRDDLQLNDDGRQIRLVLTLNINLGLNLNVRAFHVVEAFRNNRIIQVVTCSHGITPLG